MAFKSFDEMKKNTGKNDKMKEKIKNGLKIF